MQIVLDTEARKDYVRYRLVTCLDTETREKAEKLFCDYRRRGVITGNYLDNVWLVTDELSRTTFEFGFNELMFRNCCEPWIGCTSACYGECLRAYIVFQLGRYTLPFIREVLKGLKELAEMDAEEAVFRTKEHMRFHTVGFLDVLPDGNDVRHHVMDILEEEPQ